MPAISSIFLVAALVLAVVIGPQTRSWTWGPSMLALGVSVLTALPGIWKKGKVQADFGILAFVLLTAAWLALRAWISPVAEFGQADLMLAGVATGAFVSIRGIAGNIVAERILGWGIALLLLANVVVIVEQLRIPGFSPVLPRLPSVKMVSGFFAHYIEAANFLIASSMLVGGACLFGRHHGNSRILMALIAVAGLVGVWFTRSRGGILGAAAASGIFAGASLMIGKRRQARWFAPAIVAIPVIALGIGAFLLMGWSEAQAARHAGTEIEGVLDNYSRLYFLGIALSCIGLHPMAGGGSRCFSWECFQFVETKANENIINCKPEWVHNEFMQTAVDYGIIGAVLLTVLIATFGIATFIRILFQKRPDKPDNTDAWRCGGLAAITGMLVQSSFSFVFHLIPGVLLLGISLGLVSRSNEDSPGPRTLGNRIILSILALGSVALLLPAGLKGSQTSLILWPTYFSNEEFASNESRIDALTQAIKVWPQSGFYQERASLYQEKTRSTKDPKFMEYSGCAERDYHEASLLHPYDPAPMLNRANLLSLLNRDEEAEAGFAKAIQLQGGMEAAFRGHFSLANHFLRKGLRQFEANKPELAHEALECAAEQIETAVRIMRWVPGDMREPRSSIHESLGATREAVGDDQGALECYNFASTLHFGPRAHYRAGVLIGKMAVEAWHKRRPADAMALFQEARKRVEQSGKELPQGVTPSQRVEYIAYLDRTIAFLKGARVEAAKEMHYHLGN